MLYTFTEEHFNDEINPDPNDTAFDADEMEQNYDENTDADPSKLCHVSSVIGNIQKR